jgi:hypothetical protein
VLPAVPAEAAPAADVAPVAPAVVDDRLELVPLDPAVSEPAVADDAVDAEADSVSDSE